MEVMECEVVDRIPQITNDMWDTLIKTLKSAIQSHECSRLEIILVMIKRDLIYEDPGLLTKSDSNTEADRIRVETCNSWLFNQLVYLSTDEKFARSRKTSLELQGELISASGVQQPRLNIFIIRCLIEFTNSLADLIFPRKDPIDFNLFWNETDDQFKPYEFKKIRISSEEQRVSTILDCIKLLKRSSKVWSFFERDLINEVNQCVLNVFHKMGLQSKCDCMDYFLTMIRFVHEIDDTLILCILNIQTAIFHVYEKFTKNSFEMCDSLNNFFKISAKFLTRLSNIVKLFKKNPVCVQIIDTGVEMANRIADRNVAELEVFNEAAITFLKELLKAAENNSMWINKLRSLLKYVDKHPNIIRVIEFVVVEEKIQNDGYSPSWEYLVNNLIKSFEENSDDYDNKKASSNLMRILQAAMNINYELTLKVKSQRTFSYFNDYQKLVGAFLKVFNKTLKQPYFDLLDEIIISVYIGALPDFVTVNDETQIEIINVIKMPLENEQHNDNEHQNSSIQGLRLILWNIQSMSDNVRLYFEKQIVKLIYSTQHRIEIRKNIIEGLIVPFCILASSVKHIPKILVSYFDNSELHVSLMYVIHHLICLIYGQCKVYKIYNGSFYEYRIVCSKCSNQTQCDDANVIDGIYTEHNRANEIRVQKEMSVLIFKIISLVKSDNKEVRAIIANTLHMIFNHTSYEYDTDAWTDLFFDNSLDVRTNLSAKIQNIINATASTSQTSDIQQMCLQKLLIATRKSLEDSNKSLQSTVLDTLVKFATATETAEVSFIHSFRMTFLFMIDSNSFLVREGALCATEMCVKRNTTPIKILYSHTRNIVDLMVSLSVVLFLNYGVLLSRSWNCIIKLLGLSKLQEFVSKHYKLIVAMIIPYCIKHPTCIELLHEISMTVQLDLPQALGKSFRTIYPYISINQTPEMANKCIDFVIQTTGAGTTLHSLFHTDIKSTVAEILIYYHQSPECVLRAFRSILSKDGSGINPDKAIYKQMSEFIAERFLGILTYFESALLDMENENAIKKETMLSLGEIIRFLGSKHITSFRFKILAMLKTTLLIDIPGLAKVCANIWTIFIRTVDIQTLGPLLSTIFVSIAPLLKYQEDEINDIARYLVTGTLLSRHLSEVFFIEDTEFSDEIKAIVKRNSEKSGPETFVSKLNTLRQFIKHENLNVRIYALKYLRKHFSQHRKELNHLIVGQNTMDPVIIELLDILMDGCKHVDDNLQMASGECLGELGAIESSLLPQNYAPQVKFATSIHTNAFAMMALDELCRAFQFQNDTKYVDNFSLAIQEILLERKVCPKTKKNMEVWEAIPEQLRPLMEPLLTSCYTDFRKSPNIKIHPIFQHSNCYSCDIWAARWSTKLIEFVQVEETKSLLKSFRPSINRNMKILSMFLPYILLHSLQSCSENDRQQIYEELQFIFDYILKKNEATCFVSDQNRLRGIKTLSFVVCNRTTFNPAEKELDIGIKCAKLAFNLLDFLDHWTRQFPSSKTNAYYDAVKNFLNRFNKKQLAQGNFICNEYARALLYIEAYIEEEPKKRLQEELSFVAEIYAELLNPDSFEGAMALKTEEPTLSEQILSNSITGRLHESTAFFERLLQRSEITPSNMIQMMQCYLRLDQPEMALLVSNGLIQKIHDTHDHLMLQEASAEPLWRLSRFEELDELVQVPEIQTSTNWGVKCGQLLLNIRQENLANFDMKINETRLGVLKILRTTGIEQNTYQKGYLNVMKLHFINEFEQIGKIIKTIRAMPQVDDLLSLFDEWNMRLELLQPKANVLEPVLALRRILLGELKTLLIRNGRESKIMKCLDDEMGQLWIKSSDLAVTAGRLQQAQLYIMNASEYKNRALFLEKAKFYWKKGEQSTTFKILEMGLTNLEKMTVVTRSDRKIVGEAKLLLAICNAESMNIQTHVNLKYFKDAVDSSSDSEKSFVHLAQYMDRVYASYSDEDILLNKGIDLLLDIMNFYAKSMLYGSRFIYQSMPRMLSIWLDYTAKMKRDDLFKKKSAEMNTLAENSCELLPPFMFFTAFSQIVSRICHPSTEVYAIIKTILVKLIINFPQQSLWKISSVFKSSYPNRVKRCQEIFIDTRLSQPKNQKLISDFNSLAEKLIELTNKSITEKNPTVSSLVPLLPKLFSTSNFSEIIIPIEKHMLITLPPTAKRDEPAGTFNAFPNRLIYIRGIQEEVTVLMSLQRPRKVTLIGNDGKEYIVMMKPKDDLRKDFRLMEFNAVVKEYLHQDPDARERRLNIRTYAVLPLNEECGIIEWLPNVHTLRAIVLKIYKDMGHVITSRDLKQAQCSAKDTITKKRNLFLNNLIPKHPAVFAEWFKENFTTPHNWYQARSSYIKTTAVMSIVGYILGLGDRHGENILYDVKTGDTVHVDFNCLFNKGETFDFPEMVPFRLTHNMTHAMGPLGVEGLYRRCCEITLRILRAQTPTLMSVLRPFVYDPLVTWGRPSKMSDGTIMEKTDAQAMNNVKQIEDRLKGFVKVNGKTSNMPLSVDGQVNSIVLEATEIDNLASMYIGWGAYM